MHQICKYFISILLWFSIYTVNAQNQNSKDSVKTEKINLINGLKIELDVSPVITSILTKGDSYSFEGAVQTTLFQKYYPVVEFGFAGADKTSTENVNFSTNGGFLRLGTDFSAMKQKAGSNKQNNLFMIGGRLGFSHFNYDLKNIEIQDEYWEERKTYNFSNLKSTKLWFEIAAGIRVEIIKNIYMGWTIRNKRMLTNDAEGKISPWYVPGFGVNSTSSWGFNYAVGYKF